MEAFQKEQGLIDVKITKHLMGHGPEPQQQKWKLLDEKFQNLVDRYDALDFFPIEFNNKVLQHTITLQNIYYIIHCIRVVVQSTKLSCEGFVVKSVSWTRGRVRLPSLENHL